MINKMALAVNLAFGGFPHHLPPVSTAVLHPCPWCVEINHKTGHMRNIERFTKCRVCHDHKVIALPGLWPNVLRLFIPDKEATS